MGGAILRNPSFAHPATVVHALLSEHENPLCDDDRDENGNDEDEEHGGDPRRAHVDCGVPTTSAASGRSMRKIQPWPGMLSTWISPPCSRTACRAIESPRPRPVRSRPRRSPNGWNR